MAHLKSVCGDQEHNPHPTASGNTEGQSSVCAEQTPRKTDGACIRVSERPSLESWVSFWGRHNQAPLTGAYSNRKMFSPGSRSQGLKSRCRQGHAPSRGALSSSGGAAGAPGLSSVSVSVFTWLLPAVSSVPLFSGHAPPSVGPPQIQGGSHLKILHLAHLQSGSRRPHTLFPKSGPVHGQFRRSGRGSTF